MRPFNHNSFLAKAYLKTEITIAHFIASVWKEGRKPFYSSVRDFIAEHYLVNMALPTEQWKEIRNGIVKSWTKATWTKLDLFQNRSLNFSFA